MSTAISIIITIYNRENYLEECLTSVLNQTFTNFEAIMIDDGSTDTSPDIAKKFAEKDKRFKYVPTSHIGFSAAKNLGLSKAVGDFIIFLDSDDSAYPYWLELLYNAAIKTQSDISTCYYDEYVEGKKPKLPEPPKEAFMKLALPIAEYSYLKMNLIYHRFCSCYIWNKLIKKNLYNNIQFKDQIALSDFSVIYKIFDKANKVVQIQIPLIHYRRHADSICGKCSKLGLEYFLLRANLLEESTKFVWENYAQSQAAVQCVLRSELYRMQQELTKEDFYKYIDRPFFRLVLSSKPIQYFYPEGMQQYAK